MAEKTAIRDVRIAGRSYRLSSTDVREAAATLDPEPIASHFVIVGARRYPPKQLLSALTGLDRADFTSHQARRTLLRLGYAAGRRAHGARVSAGLESDHAPAGRLAELQGQWVAITQGDVLHAASTPAGLVRWLAHHGERADSTYRVPEDGVAASGLARPYEVRLPNGARPGRRGRPPRPILNVVVEGLGLAPQACLIDRGATAVRFGNHVADLCAIDLSGTPEARIAVAGVLDVPSRPRPRRRSVDRRA